MEKCMMATSLAFLLCHPNSNTKCSNSCKAITPSSKKPNPNSKPKEQENRRRRRRISSSSPQLKKPHKSKHLELASTTHLKLVYDRLKSNTYPSIQVLEDILLRGWEPRLRLVINEVLKVKHEQGVVDKFNKYREIIKQKVSKKTVVSKCYYKKLMEDGFELLCFIGSKLACREKSSRLDSICRKRYCGVCRLIGVIETSSLDSLRSVSVSESAWMAHQKAIRKEGDCRKAVIMCRVIAGRVVDHRQRRGIKDCSVKIGEDDNFDSVFVPISDSDTHDELLVFNPSAILPCFVVLYDVEDL